MYGMYGDATKRHEYRVRAKTTNGFQAIYDNTDVDSKEFSIRFEKVILPEMAALRFAVSMEDGAFIGQSFLPIAYLRSGYRHIALRNQINIPVRASSLFVFIQKKIYVNAEDQEFANRLVDPLTTKYPNSNHQQQNFDHVSSDVNLQLRESIRERNLPISLDETNWYEKHVIAGSEFNDRKRLCKILSLNDVKPEEVIKRDQIIQAKLRRISDDYRQVSTMAFSLFNRILVSWCPVLCSEGQHSQGPRVDVYLPNIRFFARPLNIGLSSLF
jgi:hypothetical protein